MDDTERRCALTQRFRHLNKICSTIPVPKEDIPSDVLEHMLVEALDSVRRNKDSRCILYDTLCKRLQLSENATRVVMSGEFDVLIYLIHTGVLSISEGKVDTDKCPIQ